MGTAMAKHQSTDGQDRVISEALSGSVIVNIGHIGKETEKQLNKLVRSGTLVKWRGHWFPVAGASHGIGPLKTCWGLASKYAAERVAS